MQMLTVNGPLGGGKRERKQSQTQMQVLSMSDHKALYSLLFNVNCSIEDFGIHLNFKL